MNKLAFTLVTSFMLLVAFDTIAQEWIRYFNGDTNFVGDRIVEYYDNGYLVTGDKETSGIHTDGWLCKTDINGFVLWEKSFQNSSISLTFNSLTTLENGDITLVGRQFVNGYHDPIIVKLNACGEKQWCKTYDAIAQYGFGYDIITLPEGGYIALFINWVHPQENKSVWLFRLDEEGEIIWQQYFPQDTIFYSSNVSRIILLPDTTIVLTGRSFTTDPGQITSAWLRPLIVKVDIEGNSLFELSWGRSDHFIGDGFASVTDKNGNIYTAGYHSRISQPYGDTPCLLKTSYYGNEVFYKDLVDSTKSGGAGTIAWFQDSTLLLNGTWTGLNPEDTSMSSVFKTDTLGNILLQKDLLEFSRAFRDCYSTFDNKVVFIDHFVLNYPYWQTVMIKLNSDLEYDSIYATPFNYDSLCPYPIVSDTIPLDDCEVIVDLDDPIEHPEKTRLHVYPNPASQKITIEMPQYLVRETGSHGRTATTIYHQWKEVRFDVFDLFGRLIYRKVILKHEKTVELDVSTWPGGMYVARVVFMNEVAGSVKFVVN